MITPDQYTAIVCLATWMYLGHLVMVKIEKLKGRIPGGALVCIMMAMLPGVLFHALWEGWRGAMDIVADMIVDANTEPRKHQATIVKKVYPAWVARNIKRKP